MSYKHIYHAGNFADILKHSLLISTLRSLQKNRKPIFILDTHSGRGKYNLLSPDAVKSGEAKNGIIRLLENGEIPYPYIINDYLNNIKSFNANKSNIYKYPGSPSIIQSLLREKDRAAFCEMNPKEFPKLYKLFKEDKRVKTIKGNGYEALLSFIPPREKRGLVLIDPPFEKKDEMEILQKVITNSIQKWPDGVFMLWYPIKNEINFPQHLDYLKANCDRKINLFNLKIPESMTKSERSLKEAAVVIINPPEDSIGLSSQINELENIMFSFETKPLIANI